jgi:hypothetical protein
MGEGVKGEEDAPVGASEDTHWRGFHFGHAALSDRVNRHAHPILQIIR